ncbi:MAG: segregation/condensation protein A [Methanomicrobiales archaeon]|nr:segregation/condensation protein A [Methanomicrobiales archaeon]MDI6875392.1 segregation/condensation protein A [Methanomicrobiales archaeon]
MDEEPIEILVGMAERGEIDPWNIDIVEVTDRFLTELERRRQLDLRISGRTLFFAATLLRLKSEYLDVPEEPDTPIEAEEVCGGEVEEFSYEPGGYHTPIERLEQEIRRRLSRKSYRKRPVTLYELIKLLKTAEKEERRRHRARAIPRESLVTTEDVVATAHSEDYRESSARVMQTCETLFRREGDLTLSGLSENLGWSITDVYIPLLFLNLEGKLALCQDAFYSDLTIRRVDADR